MSTGIGAATAAPCGIGECPEINCLRGLVSADALATAEERAARLAVDVAQVLIASGALTEEDYLRALGGTLGIDFETLHDLSRTRCPVTDSQFVEAAVAGLLPFMDGDTLRVAVAPRGATVQRLAELVSHSPDWRERFRFTSTRHLQDFILRGGGQALTARARDRLKMEKPLYSAGVVSCRGRITFVALIGLAAAGMIAAQSATMFAIQFLLTALFLAWLGLRLISIFTKRAPPASPPVIADAKLPVYTVIAALYREARSVDGLMRAIARLDYPAEKLDVILAVEADDHETRAAIDRCATRLAVTVIPAPASAPRTKPKALNAALPFARGGFVVVYDAEDRPESNQLRCALQAFRSHGDDLACVQA